MHALESIHMEALKAAREGDIDELYRLIDKNPQVLDDFDKIKFVHSPLHEAARNAQTRFAIEVMNLQPSLAKKLNPQGLSPLDLAVLEDDETIIGENEDEEASVGESRYEKRERKNNSTAIALVKLDPELIRVKGKNMMTPLHHAVMKNNQDLLAEFLCACPASIDDQTNRCQNAVHLAVENKKDDIFFLLMGWLKRRNREDVLKFGDEDGNNPLHIAVQTGQEKMLVDKVNRTYRNQKKLTALDIADMNKNVTIKRLLLRCGVRDNDRAFRASRPLTDFLKSPERILERILSLYFNVTGEMSLDMCNILLIIAVLIVTAAFQGILSPPGGLWQGNGETDTASAYSNLKAPPASVLDMQKYQRKDYKHLVGKAVPRPDIFDDFIAANTLAFVSASMVMFFVVPFRPYSIPLFVSLLFMTYSYLKAMVIVSEPSALTLVLTIIAWVLACSTFVWRLCVFFAKTLFENYWWMPRFSVPVVNLLYEFPVNKVVNTLLRMSSRFRLQQKVCSLHRRVS